MIRVLVVDDSRSVREYLRHIIDQDPELVAVGTASGGDEAIELVRSLEPDVVTMDINMPGMDGFSATRRIMETRPLPIVIVSGVWDPRETDKTFRAMQAGALAVLEKPHGPGHPQGVPSAERLVQTIKTMSQVKVVRRYSPARRSGHRSVRSGDPSLGSTRLVAVGASTGGPPVLQEILSRLRCDFPVPVLVVQHISPGFLPGMVQWLQQRTPLEVTVAGHGEELRGGRVYFAPDYTHLEVDSELRTRLNANKDRGGLCPSVSRLFASVLSSGNRAVGVLLTGMGRDGAAELKQMRERRHPTVAQDRDSSVVYGMPGEAIRIGAAEHVLTPEEIAEFLNCIGPGRST